MNSHSPGDIVEHAPSDVPRALSRVAVSSVLRYYSSALFMHDSSDARGVCSFFSSLVLIPSLFSFGGINHDVNTLVHESDY